jgi:hypothetical protein
MPLMSWREIVVFPISYRKRNCVGDALLIHNQRIAHWNSLLSAHDQSLRV